MTIALGFLIARLVFGLGLAVHGSQKLFGWFGGGGPQGTGQAFAGMGFRPGVLFAVMAGLGEFGGGLLVAAGFLGAVGPALMITVMLVAIFVVHLPNGFLASNNGWELASLYIAGALTFAFAGFGAYSIDAAMALTVFTAPQSAWLLIGIAVLLAVLNLLARRAPRVP
ncbi:MAG: DoxX family protein [Vulcanimicrobiaceae bacterium]